MNTLQRSDRWIRFESGTSFKLWRLTVDGEEITDSAKPFSASDAEIILEECNECGYCSLRDVCVRRVGDQIIWFDKPPTDRYFESLKGRVLAFNQDDYASVALSGDIQALPLMKREELEGLVRAIEPSKPDVAIYRIPDSVSDPNGRLALALLRDALATPEVRWDFAAAPDSSIELRIGLDIPGIPEAIWQVGRVDNRTAFCFLAYPELPIWMRSDALDRQFGDYVNELYWELRPNTRLPVSTS
jgi:hypothetical protein